MTDERIGLALDVKQTTVEGWEVTNGEVTVWLPRSQCGFDGEMFYMPRKLAKEKGLVQ